MNGMDMNQTQTPTVGGQNGGLPYLPVQAPGAGGVTMNGSMGELGTGLYLGGQGLLQLGGMAANTYIAYLNQQMNITKMGYDYKLADASIKLQQENIASHERVANKDIGLKWNGQLVAERMQRNELRSKERLAEITGKFDLQKRAVEENGRYQRAKLFAIKQNFDQLFRTSPSMGNPVR